MFVVLLVQVATVAITSTQRPYDSTVISNSVYLHPETGAPWCNIAWQRQVLNGRPI